MLTSLRHLLRGTLRHWYQLVGGTLMSAIGVVGQAQGWAIPALVWATLTAALLFWAVLSAYHDLRTECDAAMDGLAERRDLQGVADELTRLHHRGFHDMSAIQPGAGAIRDDAFHVQFAGWRDAVYAWNDETKAAMVRLGCTEPEVAKFWTITTLRVPGMMVYGDGFEQQIWMHRTRVECLWEVIEDYAARAKAGGR